MVADGATCGSAESTVTSHMPGNAADDCAFDAAFGTGRSRDRQERQRRNRAREGLGHVFLEGLLGGLTTPLARESSFAWLSVSVARMEHWREVDFPPDFPLNSPSRGGKCGLSHINQ
jgi:hypothetical protein